MTGWLCAGCGRGYAPFVAECLRCGPTITVTSTLLSPLPTFFEEACPDCYDGRICYAEGDLAVYRTCGTCNGTSRRVRSIFHPDSAVGIEP